MGEPGLSSTGSRWPTKSHSNNHSTTDDEDFVPRGLCQNEGTTRHREVQTELEAPPRGLERLTPATARPVLFRPGGGLCSGEGSSIDARRPAERLWRKMRDPQPFLEGSSGVLSKEALLCSLFSIERRKLLIHIYF